MRSLRSRLILSHLLPLLITVPLIGLALIYILETQVLLPNLLDQLARQAELMAEIASERNDIWTDPIEAHLFVTAIHIRLRAQVMLLSPRGYLLASSNPDDLSRLGQPLENPNLIRVLAGQRSVGVNYSQNLTTDVVDVLIPVIGPDQRVMGVVRMNQQFAGVYEQFVRLRYIIIAIAAAELILGALVGLILALDLERSLRRVTEAVYGISQGQPLQPLPERGPAEIRLLLRAFNSLAERLQNLEAARRQLLANLVHELARPLGALQSAIQALLKGADQDPAFRQELLEGMANTVQRLQPLLDDLAQLHGQILGTLELNRQPTPLNNWLSGVLPPWREAAQEKGLTWQISLPPNLPTLTFDADQIARALGNLLSNAVKYTPPGGMISVEAGVKAEMTWLRVCDTGPGIAPEEQERIFTPFYRSQTDRRFPQGLGLGLSIARDVVTAHGGRLEVESTPGQGSCFTIWLPLKPHLSSA